jgi:aspartate-semialdehyde dehydrogenase
VWVEFESNPGVEALENSLAAEWIDVRGEDLEPPTNVGQAGAGGIAVGAIQEDRNESGACWIWMAADNVRLVADNALRVVGSVI